MLVIDSIPAWLSASPSAAAAAELLPRQGEVAAQPPEGAPAFSPAFSTESPPPSPSVAPAFPDCDPLADTLLAKIAAGTECLAAIAAFHHIPYPRFTLWLLQPSTQERLAALSVAIASAARLTATAALPDIVRGLKSTVDQLQHSSHPTIAAPGPDALRAQSLILRRHRALIAAASLIYRISRFTCPAPADPRTGVPPRSALGSRCSSREREHPAAPRRGLVPLPKLDLPDFDSSSRIPSVLSVSSVVQLQSAASEHRSIPTSDIPLPTSDIDTGAPAFAPPPTASSSIPTSDFPHLTSNITPISVDDALQMLTAEYDLNDEEVAELRADSHSWIRDFIPPPAAATSATLSARPTADDG